MAYDKNKLYKSLTIDPDICPILTFRKGLGIVSPPHFVYDFSARIFFMLYSINWPNLLPPDYFSFLRYWLIEYCNCLLTRFWRYEFWNQPYHFNQDFFLHDLKVKKKIQIFWERNKLLRWNKKHFLSFLKDFQ